MEEEQHDEDEEYKEKKESSGISLHKYFIGPNCVHKSANGLV